MSDRSLPVTRAASAAVALKPTLSDKTNSLLQLVSSAMTLELSQTKRAASDAEIDRAIEELQQTLIPAGDLEAARMVNMVAVTLQVTAPQPEGLAVFMRLLGEVPADLLHLATKRVLETHTYAKLPTPGEWRQAIAAELSERRQNVNRLKHYKGKLQLAEKYYPPAKAAPVSESERRTMDQRIKSKLGQVAPTRRK